MSELLNWYVEELRQLLVAKVPAEKLDTLLREAESHLRESAQLRITEKVNEREATIDAINAYGLPKKVARSFLARRDQRVLGMKPMYASMLGCAIAIICWNFHWLTLGGFFDNFGDTWQNITAGVIGVFALGVMLAASRVKVRAYWLTTSLTVIVAAGLTVPVVSFWMVGGTPDNQGISRFHLSRDLPRVQTLVGQIDRYQDFLAKGMVLWSQAPKEAGTLSTGAYSDAKLAAQELGSPRFNPAVIGESTVHDGQFVVPRQYGAFAMVRGGLEVFETVQNYSDAKRAWAKNGKSVSLDLTRERAGMVGLIRSVDEARSGRLFFFNPDLYSQTFIGTLVLLPPFLVLNWLAAATFRPRRTWRKRQVA